MSDRTSCPLDHRTAPERLRMSAPGTVLCAGHVDELDRQLATLHSFEAECDKAAYEGALSGHIGAPVTGDPEKALIIDPRRAEHQILAGQVLVSWVKLICEEREVTPPDLNGCERVLPVLCAFLGVHQAWSVSQPWVEDYASELLELGRKAWRLLNPSGQRRFTAKQMRCVEIDDVDMSRCPGSLWVYLTPDDPTFEAESAMVCDTCGFEVMSDQWLSYGRRMKAQHEDDALPSVA